MNEIDELYNKFLDEKFSPESFLSRYIDDKFSEIGIDLSNEQLEHTIQQIYPTPKKSIKVDLSEEQLKYSGYASEEERKEDIKLIFDNLTESVSEKINNFTEALPDITKDIADEISKYLFDRVISKIPGNILEIKEEKKLFEKEINTKWGAELDLFEVLIELSLESVGKYQQNSPELTSDNDFLMESLYRLHAKACQISSEILVLLRSGYADGANARWRSLYETTVISYFICDNGNAIAEMYLDSEVVETYKGALQFQSYAERLGYEPLSENEMQIQMDNIEQINKKYGNKYKKGGYSWAATVINKDKPTFRDIELSIELDHMRPYYKSASQSVHASAHGLFFQLGLQEESHLLLAGSSNTGLSDPCFLASVALSQITSNILLNEQVSEDNPNMDNIVTSQILFKLKDLIDSELKEI